MKIKVKSKVKHITLQLLFLLIRLRRLIFSSQGTIFVAPDIPASNLGDQALLCGSIEGFYQQQHQRVRIVLSGPEKIPEIIRCKIAEYGYILDERFPVFFATSRAFTETLQFYWLVSSYQRIMLVGADVLDGTYNAEQAVHKINMMGQCAKLGLQSRIFGFSLSTDIKETSKRAIGNLSSNVGLLARDSISQNRAQALRECGLVADCAFLMKPIGLKQSKLLQNIRIWKQQKKSKVLGVCIRKEDFTTREAQLACADTLSIVVEKTGVRLIMIPHHPSDIEAQSVIVKALEKREIDLHVVTELPLAMEIKAIAAECDHVLTSRMHVAIASLGSLIPVTCIPYAGKFEGLLKHFCIKNAILPSSTFLSPSRASEFIIQSITAYSIRKSDFKKKLEFVNRLSLSSFGK